MTPSLILVPTPIGNLKDITHRAIEVLESVDLILSEDTRTSGKLLKYYDISTRQQSFHIHNEHRNVASIVSRLSNGEKMALISDAGTPGISDPGFLLVRECLEAGIEIECLPGPTALVPALVKSGFPTDRFIFEGFLPHKKGRQTRIKEFIDEKRTIIIYESPHRLMKLLSQLQEFLGDSRKISVSRELSKIYEETQTGTIADVISYFTNSTVKGEIVVVIEGK